MGALYEYFEMQPARFEDTIVKYMKGRRYGAEMARILLRRARDV
jgi:hypothetical protein